MNGNDPTSNPMYEQAPDQSGYTGSSVAGARRGDPAHPQPPDQNYGESALPGVLLPLGESTQGMTDNVNPDGASLTEGFSHVDIAGPVVPMNDEDGNGMPGPAQSGGFVGRALGWER